MKPIRLFLLALALVSVVVAGTAQAANPPSGTLSKSKKSLSWTGEFTLSEPNPYLMPGCLAGTEDPICDHFFLKVNMRDGARVTITLPSPSATTDLDLFVFSPTGAEVGSSGNLIGQPESITFRHSGRFRNQPYEVQVVPFIVVPGTTYKATARVR
jgi:hypothetical protein